MGEMERDFRKVLGERLKTARKERGLTQKALASRIEGKVDYTYIGRMERGSQFPSLKMLKKISDALSLPLSYFFKEEGKKQVPPLLPLPFAEQLKDERWKGLFNILSRIHPDDINFFIEIATLLERHRRSALYSVSEREELKVAEKGEKYTAKEGVVEGLESLMTIAKDERVREILRKALEELNRLATRGG